MFNIYAEDSPSLDSWLYRLLYTQFRSYPHSHPCFDIGRSPSPLVPPSPSVFKSLAFAAYIRVVYQFQCKAETLRQVPGKLRQAITNDPTSHSSSFMLSHWQYWRHIETEPTSDTVRLPQCGAESSRLILVSRSYEAEIFKRRSRHPHQHRHII